VSHDLRAPLRPIDGFSQAVLEEWGPKLDDKARDYLTRIRAAAQRMGHIIEDLLKLSRLSRGDMSLQPVDLASIAQSIAAELRVSEPERAVSFKSPAAAPCVGDARLLRIALENLIRNAWKFTRKREDPVIELGVQQDEGRNVYFLRDNGAGFAQDQSARLFQPFQRLHSAAEFEGTGIGLAIVGRIIHRHGGRIWAESSPGQGATFFFTLGEQRG
jgi:signal transduction histidine kinase